MHPTAKQWLASFVMTGLWACRGGEVVVFNIGLTTMPERPTTDTSVQFTVLANGDVSSATAFIDGSATNLVLVDPRLFTISAAGPLPLGIHNLTVTAQSRGSPAHTASLSYQWEVIDAQPTVAIVNPPTLEDFGVAGWNWTAFFRPTAAVSSYRCAVGAIALQPEWLDCCDTSFGALPSESALGCVADCRSSLGARARCATAVPLFEKCVADLAIAQPRPVLLGDVPCNQGVIVASFASSVWPNATEPAVAAFSVSAVGLRGAVAPATVWHWVALALGPPPAEATNDASISPSDSECPGPNVGLLAFTVACWAGVFGLVIFACLRRDELAAGVDPKKARMRRNFESPKGISVVTTGGGASRTAEGGIVMNLTQRTAVSPPASAGPATRSTPAASPPSKPPLRLASEVTYL
eukprot:m.190026 g.190026  ORF g.190026 m.190026 type:complete len:410 (+) comp15124_c0_seq2:146-1375(+)